MPQPSCTIPRPWNNWSEGPVHAPTSRRFCTPHQNAPCPLPSRTIQAPWHNSGRRRVRNSTFLPVRTRTVLYDPLHHGKQPQAAAQLYWEIHVAPLHAPQRTDCTRTVRWQIRRQAAPPQQSISCGKVSRRHFPMAQSRLRERRWEQDLNHCLRRPAPADLPTERLLAAAPLPRLPYCPLRCRDLSDQSHDRKAL